MKQPRPPRSATWLLTHLGCSPNNEAVIGDLHERYRLCPKPAWYWRQALMAIAKSFFSEVWRHKLDATYALVVGWATLIAIWSMSAPVVGNADVQTHHACTFFWFIAGIASGCSVACMTKRPKRAMVLIYVVSILFLLIALHPRPSASYVFTYWIDAVVLFVSILLGAVPIKSPEIKVVTVK